MTALTRLRAVLGRELTPPAERPAPAPREAATWVAIPIPPPGDWLLLSDPSDVPADHMVLGRLRAQRERVFAPLGDPSPVRTAAAPDVCAACPLRQRRLTP